MGSIVESTGAALLDAIYAAPGDRTPREVYGDWLQQRGDPRGELIALQLRGDKTPEQIARERELISAHAETWIGKLAEITTWAEFELGFLARCGLARIPAWAIGRREWATVKHIGLSDGLVQHVTQLVTHPAMRSLESLRLGSRALDALLGLPQAARLPIRRLTTDGCLMTQHWHAIESAPLFAPLVELELRRGTEDYRQIRSSRLHRVAHEVNGWGLTWTRGDDDRLSVVAVSPPGPQWGTPTTLTLRMHLEELPPDSITKIDLGATMPYLRANGFSVDALMQVLEQHPRVVVDQGSPEAAQELYDKLVRTGYEKEEAAEADGADADDATSGSGGAYIARWNAIAGKTGTDLVAALAKEWAFLGETPACKPVLAHLLAKVKTASIVDGRLAVVFDDQDNGETTVACSPPTTHKIDTYPKSWQRFMRCYDGMEVNSNRDVPTFFNGTYRSGAFEQRYIEEVEPELYEKAQQHGVEFDAPIDLGRDWVVANPLKNNKLGEPALYFHSREGSGFDEPYPLDLPLAGVFLRLMTRQISGKDFFVEAAS